MSEDRLTVVKAGGSLLASPADLRRVASAIVEARRAGGSLLVVVSALKGVTDLLDLAARQAKDRSQNGHLDTTVHGLRRRHHEFLEGIAGGDSGDSVHGRVREALDEVEAVVRRIRAAERSRTRPMPGSSPTASG
jgi:aspartokinase